MRFNKGFTLAEVLIALGIVGVLAALTLPTLQANTNQKTIGAAVMKVVQQLENAHKMILSENDAETLETPCGAKNYPKCLSKYLSLAEFQPETSDKYSSSDFGKDTKDQQYDKCTNAYASDDGFVYFRTNSCDTLTNMPFTSSTDKHMSEKYNGEAYYITVDINGIETKPNQVGRDVFRFIVDTNGAVIPLGSRLYAKYYTAGKDNVWTNTCPSGKKPTGKSGWYCTGSIVDNGGKVLYKF